MLGLSPSYFFFSFCVKSGLIWTAHNYVVKIDGPAGLCLLSHLSVNGFALHNGAHHTRGAVWNLSFWGFPTMLSGATPSFNLWLTSSWGFRLSQLHAFTLQFLCTFHWAEPTLFHLFTSTSCLPGYAGYKLCYYEVMKVIKGIVHQPYEVKGSSIFYAFSYYFDRAVESGLIGEWAQTKQLPSSATVLYVNYHPELRAGIQIARLPCRAWSRWCNWSQGL